MILVLGGTTEGRIAAKVVDEADKPFYTISLKCDKNTPMGIITDVKQVLRKSYALKIVYSANKKQ